MAEFLIKAQDAPVPDGAGKWYAARIVYVGEDGHTWGGEEGPPKFYIIKVPGVSRDDALQYTQEWRHDTAMNIASSNLATDTHSIEITSSMVSATGQNAFTAAKVQTFFERWGATNIVVADALVTFDIAVFDAITSQGFWDVDVSGVVFSETDYDQGTGEHTVQIVSSPYSNAAMASKVREKGGAVVPPDSFIMTRAVAREELTNDIRERIERALHARRRWYVKASGMAALQAAGGIMTVTPAQFVNNISDGLLD